ncbi:MAG: hypothetical protein Q9227_001676 [Pyrenula ochraceoflavens]
MKSEGRPGQRRGNLDAGTYPPESQDLAVAAVKQACKDHENCLKIKIDDTGASLSLEVKLVDPSMRNIGDMDFVSKIQKFIGSFSQAHSSDWPAEGDDKKTENGYELDDPEIVFECLDEFLISRTEHDPLNSTRQNGNNRSSGDKPTSSQNVTCNSHKHENPDSVSKSPSRFEDPRLAFPGKKGVVAELENRVSPEGNLSQTGTTIGYSYAEANPSALWSTFHDPHCFGLPEKGQRSRVRNARAQKITTEKALSHKAHRQIPRVSVAPIRRALEVLKGKIRPHSPTPESSEPENSPDRRSCDSPKRKKTKFHDKGTVSPEIPEISDRLRIAELVEPSPRSNSSGRSLSTHCIEDRQDEESPECPGAPKKPQSTKSIEIPRLHLGIRRASRGLPALGVPYPEVSSPGGPLMTRKTRNLLDAPALQRNNDTLR